ncbi:MAG: gas vesicle protein GvpN [Planctomycetota bacterium]
MSSAPSDAAQYVEAGPRHGGSQPSDELVATPSESFVASERVQSITERAMLYLGLGYPVHLAGPAGTGKTTLAFHIVAQLGNPVSLIHGNDEFGTGDLIGKDSGYTKTSIVDNYISSVLKTKEDLSVKWTDNRLTLAAQQGHTLIYNEFNRTRPEANNILLSILEEGVLNLPKTGGGFLEVHPSFRCVLTSNPVEYAGMHQTQDALLDRLVTIRCDHYDAQTEVNIATAKSGIDAERAGRLVSMCRAVRERTKGGARPTIRTVIALARVVAACDCDVDADDSNFMMLARDLLGTDLARDGSAEASSVEAIREIIAVTAPVTASVTPRTPRPRRIQQKKPSDAV